MSNERLSPALGAERIHSIDVIRGLAILGIFFVNMPSFFSPILYLNPATWWTGELNQWTNSIIDIFAQASFYTLFHFFLALVLFCLRKEQLLKDIHFIR